MTRKRLFWTAFALLALGFATLQFVPSPPLLIPADLPLAQRENHRLLAFEGIANFRDLGGYTTAQGQHVKWGVLYRAGTLADATATDLADLRQLHLATLIDFRSSAEKEEEPNRLPDPVPFEVIEIPTLDDGNKAMVGEIMARIESGNFDGFDPNLTMLQANRQFATEFTPQFKQFIQTILEASGAPVVWHCSAGKDRTGFAAAILLRILGVDQTAIMQDYMASKQLALEARKSQLLLLRVFKGEEAADKLAVLMGVEQDWLQAAFDEINAHWGSFDQYVSDGLGLSAADINQLRSHLLENQSAAAQGFSN